MDALDYAQSAKADGAEVAAWRQRRETIIEKYGSVDAAVAPCQRESKLLTAVAPWRTCHASNPRWTYQVDGWSGAGADYRSMPAHVLEAIRAALPLPVSFAESRREHAYWTDRNRELEDVVSLDGAVCGDIQLDLVAEVRAAIVHDLAMHEIRVTNIVDLHGRFAMYREADVDDPRVDDALFRDIAAMAVAAQSQPSTARPHAPSDAADRIQTALNADPSRSDRDIARSLQCSPTTVGKARAALGLRSSTRAV